MCNKDTAPSNGEQQSRRDEAAVDEEEESAVQRGTARRSPVKLRHQVS